MRKVIWIAVLGCIAIGAVALSLSHRSGGLSDHGSVAQELFEYGMRRGAQDARKGSNFLPQMEADPPMALVAIGMTGDQVDLPDATRIRASLKAAPGEWQMVFAKTFTAGYALGQQEASIETKPTDVDTDMKGLRSLRTALMMYLAEHGEVLPPTKDYAKVRSSLKPYISAEESAQATNDHPVYSWNGNLSGKRLTAISNPESIVTFYEASPASDGSRGTAFLDGSVRRLSKSEWDRVSPILQAK